MVPRLLSATLVLVFVPLTLRAGETKENPFKKAKVGDWASYKTTGSFGGNGIQGKMKLEVTAKDDNSVTLKTAVTFGDKELPAKESKIDLTKPFSPQSLFTMGPKGKAKTKVEKDGEGKEKIEVGGKTYNCTWTKSKVTTSFGDNEFTSEVKIWSAPNAPLTGIVKMETKMEQGGFTMQLSGSGSGG